MGSGQRLLDLVDQLLVQVDKAAEEVDHELQVLLPVRQAGGTLLGFIGALAEVVDVVPQRGEAVAGDLFAVVDADSEATIHRRLAADPWVATNQLVTHRVDSWTILVGTERLPYIDAPSLP
jgi:hypothetical protein